MNRKTIKRLFVKGTVAYAAIFSIVLMVAMPAMALIAGSIGSLEIKDHSIKSIDISNSAVTTDRIAPRAVKRGKIAKRAIRTEHVQSINESKINYKTRTKRLALPAAAFQPYISSMGYGNFGYVALSDPGVFVAPVSLPDGARVTKFRIICLDSSTTGNFQGMLKRYNYPTKKIESLSSTLTSSGAPSSWQYLTDNTINNSIINNTNNSYVVYAFTGHELAIGQALITYQVKGP